MEQGATARWSSKPVEDISDQAALPSLSRLGHCAAPRRASQHTGTSAEKRMRYINNQNLVFTGEQYSPRTSIPTLPIFRYLTEHWLPSSPSNCPSARLRLRSGWLMCVLPLAEHCLKAGSQLPRHELNCSTPELVQSRGGNSTQRWFRYAALLLSRRVGGGSTSSRPQSRTRTRRCSRRSRGSCPASCGTSCP